MRSFTINDKKEIRNAIIAGLVLLLIGTLLSLIPGFYSWIFNFIKWAYEYLNSYTAIPRWIFILLVSSVVFAIYKYARYKITEWMNKDIAPQFTLWQQAFFFDNPKVIWVWNYDSNNNPNFRGGLCAKHKIPLVQSYGVYSEQDSDLFAAKSYLRAEQLLLKCENCDTVLFAFKGDSSELASKIERQIMGYINSGEWQKLLFG